jgi:cytochrome c5
MGEHDDKVFLKRFGGIIAGLVIVTILIIIIAVGNERQQESGVNPSRDTLAAERIAPAGAVRTELPAEQPAQAESASEDIAAIEDAAATIPATEEEAPTVADSAIDGEAIYNSACMACHASGAAGAPIPGSEAWAERVAKGTDALVSSAVNGMGIMPPKGGRPDFSDDDIRAAVEHMLAQ